jgi:hypothetical protein
VPKVTSDADTRAMLLSWFDLDELTTCSQCGRRHVLPTWGTVLGPFCATCGLIEGEGGKTKA